MRTGRKPKPAKKPWLIGVVFDAHIGEAAFGADTFEAAGQQVCAEALAVQIAADHAPDEPGRGEPSRMLRIAAAARQLAAAILHDEVGADLLVQALQEVVLLMSSEVLGNVAFEQSYAGGAIGCEIRTQARESGHGDVTER